MTAPVLQCCRCSPCGSIRARDTFIAACLATALIFVGYPLSGFIIPGLTPHWEAAGRTLHMGMLWSATLLVYFRRRVLLGSMLRIEVLVEALDAELAAQHKSASELSRILTRPRDIKQPNDEGEAWIRALMAFPIETLRRVHPRRDLRRL